MKIRDLKKIKVFHVNTTLENVNKLNKALDGPEIINNRPELKGAETTFFQKDEKTWRVHFNFKGGTYINFYDIELPKDNTPTNVFVEVPGLKELKDVCWYLEDNGFLWAGGAFCWLETTRSRCVARRHDQSHK